MAAQQTGDATVLVSRYRKAVDLAPNANNHQPIGRWHLHKSFQEAGFALDWESSFGDAGEALAGSPRLRLPGKLLDRLSALPVGARGAILCCAWRKPDRSSPATHSDDPPITTPVEE